MFKYIANMTKLRICKYKIGLNVHNEIETENHICLYYLGKAML